MVKKSDFVHLHVHSDFSIDGACNVDKLVAKAQSFGHIALALTDHGNVAGAVHLHKKAKKLGIKPIIGSEVYISANGRMNDRTPKNKAYYHLTLLAKNQIGYANLCRLSTLGYTDGFYYKPRVDWEALAKHSEGLVCLSGCVAGPLSVPIYHEEPDVLKRNFEHLESIYKDDLFLEIQPHVFEKQYLLNSEMIRLSYKTGIPLAVSCDVHYIEPEDWDIQGIKSCVANMRKKDEGNDDDDEGTGEDTSSKSYKSQNHSSLHYRSTAEVLEIFRHVPQAVLNTRAVAERIGSCIETGKNHLPSFGVENEQEFFREVIYTGLHERYGEVLSKEVTERAEYEISVIAKENYISYFLIIWDLIAWAKKNRIPVGPGRGSAAGSLVAYALKITALCPLKYNLYFERFLNPDRVSMPDVDMDFCERKRQLVIDYTRERYGLDRVAQIATYNRVKAKSAVKDVGRVMNLSSTANLIAKAIPEDPKIKFVDVLKMPHIRSLLDSNKDAGKIIDFAVKVEGLIRQAGRHAAGVVIGDKPLVERVPLMKVKDDLVTQFEMSEVEAVGLLKMDFLGLRNLTVIDDCLDLIGRVIDDPNDIPLDCPKTYELLSKGQGIGVFQLESEGMRELLRKMKPDNIEDIIAIVALYRPGPMASNMHISYVERKHGREPVTYLHPSLEPILQSTYGTMIYQEQIIRIAHEVAGLTRAQADTVRKATGKKNIDLMNEVKTDFLAGLKSVSGFSEDQANALWDQIIEFSEYSFNRSHSACYGVISYWTAYLKTHYPEAYMSAIMTSFSSTIEKVSFFIKECKKMGIAIQPPCLRNGEKYFKPGNGEIIFGYGSIKGFGESVVRSIEEACISIKKCPDKSFSFWAVATELAEKGVPRAGLQKLIHSGAFDFCVGSEAQFEFLIEGVLKQGTTKKNAKKKNKHHELHQISMFTDSLYEEDVVEASIGLPKDIPEWNKETYRKLEKEALGINIKWCPIEENKELIARFSSISSSQLTMVGHGNPVIIGAIILGSRVFTDKFGRPMAVVDAEDMDGPFSFVIFSTAYKKYENLIVEGSIVFIEGDASCEEGKSPSIKASRLVSKLKAPESFKTSILLIFSEMITEEKFHELEIILTKSHGSSPVIYALANEDSTNFSFDTLDTSLWVDPTPFLIRELEEFMKGYGQVFERATPMTKEERLRYH